jgi:hypothetical protein
MFLLGPAVRFGYSIYPLGLIGWLALTRENARTVMVPTGLTEDAGVAGASSTTARSRCPGPSGLVKS